MKKLPLCCRTSYWPMSFKPKACESNPPTRNESTTFRPNTLEGCARRFLIEQVPKPGQTTRKSLLGLPSNRTGRFQMFFVAYFVRVGLVRVFLLLTERRRPQRYGLAGNKRGDLRAKQVSRCWPR